MYRFLVACVILLLRSDRFSQGPEAETKPKTVEAGDKAQENEDEGAPKYQTNSEVVSHQSLNRDGSVPDFYPNTRGCRFKSAGIFTTYACKLVSFL